MRRASVVVGIVLFVATIGIVSPVNAETLKNVTCERFLTMDPAARTHIVYWAHAAEVVTTRKHVTAGDVEIGYDAFGRPIAEVVIACTADRKASLLEKIKRHF